MIIFVRGSSVSTLIMILWMNWKYLNMGYMVIPKTGYRFILVHVMPKAIQSLQGETYMPPLPTQIPFQHIPNCKQIMNILCRQVQRFLANIHRLAYGNLKLMLRLLPWTLLIWNQQDLWKMILTNACFSSLISWQCTWSSTGRKTLTCYRCLPHTASKLWNVGSRCF